MPSYAEIADKVTTQLLEAVKPVQEYAGVVADAVDRVAGKLPSLPLPAASEVLAAHFSAADRLLAAQRDLAQRLVPGPRDAAQD